MTPMFAGKCECGCNKVYGSQYGDSTHSDWCPWSPCYTPPVAKKRCEAPAEHGTGACGAEAAYWIRYSGDLFEYYYCKTCYQSNLFVGRGIDNYGAL